MFHKLFHIKRDLKGGKNLAGLFLFKRPIYLAVFDDAAAVILRRITELVQPIKTGQA